MAKNNYILKLVAAIMVIELVMADVGATHVNGNFGSKNSSHCNATHFNDYFGNKISVRCIAACALACIACEELLPLCMTACLLTCEDDPRSASPDVKSCTTACAKSTCSKYIGSDLKDVEDYGQCIADECIDKCLSEA
ncbi:uncharacterized protein LOC141688794 [Apium graveolens]|uniref:uncharacterized protein LOC141688794 n=1 Tax=Apium graveolens TaxID=4045 RepID=UPI003D79DDAF